MVPLLDANNLYTKLHQVSCLSNIPFTWTHKTESNSTFIHMTALTLHETQCGMHCIRVQDGTRQLSLMFLLFLLAQGGYVTGTLHWCARVMEDMVVRAYIFHYVAAHSG